MFQELELKEGWATVALLLIVCLIVAWSIQGARWTEGLTILQEVVVVGGILGIVLAKSRAPNRTAHLLSSLAGFTWSAYLTSRILASATGMSIEEAVVELERQLRGWIYVLFTGGTSAGNLIFVLLLGLLMWIMTYFSAWAIFRWQRVWWAVIVCGIAMMINITYAPNNLTGFLIAFILFSLLLVVRTSLAFYEEEWRVARVGYSPELVYAFLRAGLVIAILTIALAWLAPVALASRPAQEAFYKLGEPWRKLQDQSSRIFQDLNYRNEPVFIAFTRSMKFGGAVQLTDKPVMDVEAEAGRYWRVMVFHEYTSDGWTNTDTDTIILDENAKGLSMPDFELRLEVTQTITLQQKLSTLGTIAAAGQPVRAGIPLRAVVSLVTEDAEPSESAERPLITAAPGDPSVLYSQVPIEAQESYQVVSSITKADEESLREAGTDYPDWVAPRYLQLPDSVPERVLALAEQITAGRETPYDKAKAIERYLREIPYNEMIDAPPEGQDGVDYFLFDSREGYCDYYSSAMVVMLRSVDVPARYVRGYSRGQKEEGAYHVLEKNGHAWPEVYFPGYGWIEFEPTAGEPVLVRPSSQNPTTDGNPDDSGPRRDRPIPDERLEMLMDDPTMYGPYTPPPPELWWQQAGRWGGFTLAVIAAILTFIALLMARRRRRTEGMSVIERVYFDLVEWVRRLLQISPLAHQTPHEYAGTLAATMPRSQQAVERIADLYVEERFGGKAIDGEEAEEAWRNTRPALRRRWLQSRGERLLRRLPRFLAASSTRPTWQEEVDSAT